MTFGAAKGWPATALVDSRVAAGPAIAHLGVQHKMARVMVMVEHSLARGCRVGSTAEVALNGYGPSMRNVLRLAAQHAETWGHSEIEPEHFVLGLLDKADGPAMSLFRHFAIDAERVKVALLQKMTAKSP